jgi:hypothetical protein
MTRARDRRAAPQYAERHEVEDAAAQMPSTHLDCRVMRHSWVREDAVHIARLRYFRVSFICQRCSTRRISEVSESGHEYASTYEYAEGYLSHGIGRIVGEGRDAIRLAALQRDTVREVRRKATDEDMPRFGATREGLDE